MIPLHEFNQMIDTDYKSPWDQCKQDGLIQKFKVPTDELSERDQYFLKLTAVETRRKYRIHWAKYFNQFLAFKQPFIVNGGHYHSIDDDIDLSLVKDKKGNYVPMESDSEEEPQPIV